LKVRLAWNSISVLVLALASAGPFSLCAQEQAGGITGKVVDATGAAAAEGAQTGRE
jgi:hypothetical protein